MHIQIPGMLESNGMFGLGVQLVFSALIGMMMKVTSSPKLRIVWHRRDLRLHDNVLYQNLNSEFGETKVVSLYIFDDDDFRLRPATCTTTALGWMAVNIGPHATRLQIESVQDLRESIRRIGGELLVRKGSPAMILSELVQRMDPTEVVWSEEPGVYEARVSRDVGKAIRAINPLISIQTHLQYTLYHPDDLPNGEQDWQYHLAPKNSKTKKQVNKAKSTLSKEQTKNVDSSNQRDCIVDIAPSRWNGMPRIMGEFRKAAREACRHRRCLPSPTSLSKPDILPPSGEIPTVLELYQSLLESSKTQSFMGFSHGTIQGILEAAQRHKSYRNLSHGGENAALAHVTNFCRNHASTAVRNLACVDDHQSSRISHFLALGCLSPRKVVEVAEDCGENCNWIISHMTMRDFFLYTCLANGSKFYQLDGIPVSTKHVAQLIWKDMNSAKVQTEWQQFAMGETGLPLVDAAMKELLETGYCSNRVRQNAASFLTKDLGIDWRAGAEWFQFLLEDHCVGANWGNWLYFSGVGPDPKQRHFRTISQALKYDPDGSYVKRWLPILQEIQGEEAFIRPWDYTTKYWKQPIVPPESQYIWQDIQRLTEKGYLRQVEKVVSEE